MGSPFRAFIEGSPQVEVSTPAQTSIGTTAALILPIDPKRKGLILQNTGTTVIKLTFGAVLPTQTVYHLALAGCAVADDGSGASYFESSWAGVVNAISSGAGGTFVTTVFRTGTPDWNQAWDWGLR